MSKKSILHILLAGLVCQAVSTSAVDVVRNGGFDEVLVGWEIPEALADLFPYDAALGAAALRPWNMAFDYRGPVLNQPLNVPLKAGDTVEVSVDLKASWQHDAGPRSVAVYLEFLDTAAARHRVRVINPDDNEIGTDWTTFTTTHTPAAGMSKLVGVSLAIETDDYFYADNVKVSTPTAGAPVPELEAVTPTVAYGQNLVIQGRHFGTGGRVLLSGSPNGLTIQSWSDTEIVVEVNDPCVGGPLTVEAAGVRSWQPRRVTITSPHYTLATKPAKVLAVLGQQLSIAVFANFENNFAPAEGITFTVPGYGSGVAQLSTNVIYGRGGTQLTFDTAGLSAGMHQITVEATGGGLQPRTTTFEIDLRQIGRVEMSYYLTSDPLPLEGAHFTRQTSAQVVVQIFDTAENEITGELPWLPMTSSNPSALDVYLDPAPWGGHSLLVQASGAAVLTLTAPNGSDWTASVSATIPAHPSIVSADFLLNPMSNAPDITNAFTFVASGAMSRANWGQISFGVTTVGGGWGSGNKSYTDMFILGEATKPGEYLFYGGGTMDGGSATAYRKLQVVNAPTTGLIRGLVNQLKSEMHGHGHGIEGTLEFYDATSGVKLFEREIWERDNRYTVPHLEPGVYKLRWMALDWEGNPLVEPQWYPNAATIDQAQAVTVPANTVVSNINFFVSPAPVPVSAPPEITEPPAFNPGTGEFSVQIQTESGAVYELLKSTSLLDHSWWPVAEAWGDGEPQTLKDTEATGTKGFYRVIRR